MDKLATRYVLSVLFVLIVALFIVANEASRPVQVVSPLAGRAVSPTPDYTFGDSNVTRVLPGGVITPGTVFTVDIVVDPVESLGDTFWAIEEYVPMSFDILADGGADNVGNNGTHYRMLWSQIDNTTPASDITFTYQLNATTSGTFAFNGVFNFENTTNDLVETTLGDTALNVVNEPPVVTTSSPANGFSANGHSIPFICDATDTEDLYNLTLFANYTGPGYTVISQGAGTVYVQSINTVENNIPYGEYSWYCEACDSAGSCDSTIVKSFTLTNPAPTPTYVPVTDPYTFYTENFSINCTGTDAADGVDSVIITPDANLLAKQSASTTISGADWGTHSLDFENVIHGTYTYSCFMNDSLGSSYVSGNRIVNVDLSPTADPDESNVFIEGKPRVEGLPINVTVDIRLFNFQDTRDLAFALPNWNDNNGDFVIFEDNVSLGAPDVYNGTHLNFTFNASRTYQIIFSANPPDFNYGIETEGENYTYYFNVTSQNHFENVSGNLTINDTYAYYQLYWYNGTNWTESSTGLALDIDIPNSMASFDNLHTSDQQLYVEAEGVCSQAWVCTSWSACSSGTQIRSCSCVCQDNACTGDGSTSASCTVPSNNPPPGNSPGGDTVIARERTDVFDFEESIYQIEVTYTSYSTIALTMVDSVETIADLNRGIFDISGSLVLTSGVMRFKVSKEWVNIKNIDVDTIGLKKLVEGKWVDVSATKIDEDGFDYYFETTFTSLGTYAVVGQESESAQIDPNLQFPGNANESNNSNNNTWIEPPTKSDSFSLFLYIAIIVIMVAGLVAGFYISANKKLKTESKQTEKKKISELKNFIQDSMASGMAKEDIRKKLVNAGWNKEVIGIYLK